MSPSLIDRLSISLAELKRRGYFDRPVASGVIDWRLGQVMVAQVELTLQRDEAGETGLLSIRYERAGQRVEQSVELIRLASNLGRGGGIWYLICAQSGKRHRCLYFEPGQGFVSRHVAGMRYAGQQCSRADRWFEATRANLRRREQHLQAIQIWLARPRQRYHYRGQLTRPMRRLIALLGEQKE